MWWYKAELRMLNMADEKNLTWGTIWNISTKCIFIKIYDFTETQHVSWRFVSFDYIFNKKCVWGPVLSDHLWPEWERGRKKMWERVEIWPLYKKVSFDKNSFQESIHKVHLKPWKLWNYLPLDSFTWHGQGKRKKLLVCFLDPFPEDLQLPVRKTFF